MARPSRFGSGIRPQLGLVDYSPIAKGGEFYAQAISNIGQIAGSAIRDYKQKKEEEKKIGETIGFLETNFKKDPGTYTMFDDGAGKFDRAAAEAAVRSVGPSGVMTFINFSQAAQANRDVKAEKDAEKTRRRAVDSLLGMSDPVAQQSALAAATDDVRSAFQQENLKRQTMQAQLEGERSQATLRDTQALALAQEMQTPKMPTAPAGYEYTQSGALRAIPGGPAAIAAEEKMTAKEEKQRALDERVRSQQIKLDATLGNINQAIRLSRGGAGGPFEGIPFVNQATRIGSFGTAGSKTSDLSSLIDSIKAGVAIDEIEALKAQSPTGSTGFGNLTEGEREALSSVIVQLKPDLTEKELQDRLIKLRDTMMKLRGNRSANPQTAESIAPESEDDAALANRFLGRNRGFQPTIR
jgi:hypothetical protein